EFKIQFILLDKNGNTVFGFNEGNRYSRLVYGHSDIILDIAISGDSSWFYFATYDSIVQYSMDNSNGSTLIDIKGIQAQFFCFDIQTNSVIIIGETSQGYLLHLQRIDANRNITKVHLPYVEHPTEITCVAEKRVAVISHGNELVIFEIENLTWTTLQTPYQEAHLRLAVHQTDNDIFCAETKQNEIFRLSYDGKYFTKVYEGNEGEITDFDVDHTFVYVLTKNPRDCKTNVEAVNNNEIKEQHKHNEVYEVRVRMTKIKMKKTGGDEGTKKRAGIQQKDSDRGSEP
ncbi:uncharacterized protein LOC134237134, partial [Saccostrea cucullata]|uniref:uncharacterized protein LOC134237134 n=1 Tax=Saccostrea cuccullata TaxID=36930 RepID=UPI002ECFCCBB